MIIEILISVVLLFVGIVVLVVIHVCIAGRPFRESESDGGGGGEKSKTTPFEDLKKKLPCYEYKAEDKGSSSSSPVDCVVCLENFMVGEKCRLLPNCSHSFHVECIDSWLLKTPVCPICRTRVCSSEICLKEEVSVGSGNVGTESI